MLILLIIFKAFFLGFALFFVGAVAAVVLSVLAKMAGTKIPAIIRWSLAGAGLAAAVFYIWPEWVSEPRILSPDWRWATEVLYKTCVVFSCASLAAIGAVISLAKVVASTASKGARAVLGPDKPAEEAPKALPPELPPAT